MTTDVLTQHLLFQLDTYRPSSILFLTSSQSRNQLTKAITQWTKINNCSITTLHPEEVFPHNLQRHEFAIIFDYLNHLSKNVGIQRLGQLRNLYSHRIWVTDNSHSDYRFNDFIGLGFQQLLDLKKSVETTENEPPSDSPTITYGYDLATYNHQRQWNNSKYWANPENWHKYRW